MPALAGLHLVALMGPAGHACSDHICQCLRRAPAAPASPSMDCHLASASSAPPDCQLRAACRHKLPLLEPTRPCLAPDEAPRAMATGVEPLERAPARGPLAGILRIDLPPPKHL